MTDYDRTDIPAAYDRGRDHGPEVADLWMRAVEAHLDRPPARLLDLGCGTGRFADVLSVHFGAEVIGLDPSEKMLAQARGKPHAGRVRYVRARAEAMPVQTSSVDAIFMSMSLHHFGDQDEAAAECRRVLRDRGRVVIRTGTREQIPVYPYYPFFPTSHPILEEVLPAAGRIRAIYESAGFGLLGQALLTQTIAPDWATYAEKLATRADSVMARLAPEDFARGLAAIREHARWTGGQAVVEPIDLLVFG